MGINIIGYGTKTAANPSLFASLVSGQAATIPAGQYQFGTGPYTAIQWYDPISTIWRPFLSTPQDGSILVASDGYNYRAVNLTGTVVAAIVTNGGSAMTNGFYPANTGATYQAVVTGTTTAFNVVVGGAVNTTVTITAAGSGYTKPPIIQVANPATGGLAATMTCALTSGAITSVTVVNQGAGYTTAPVIVVIPANGDTTGTGGVLTATLDSTNSGKITALTVASSAASLTSVPTISFTGTSGSPAATAIMCVTATAVTWSGPNHSGNGNFGMIGSTVVAGTSTTTNPLYTTGVFQPRFGFTAFSTTGSPTTTTIIDGGLHQTAPNAVLVNNSDGTINAATTTTVTFGGVTDTIFGVQI